MTGTDTDDERQGLLLGNEQSYQSTSSVTCASLSSIAPLHDKRSRSEFTWVLIAIWSGVFLSALDGTIVAILATSIGSYFDEAHLASYIGTSYLLSSCCFTPLYGRASDILGRKTAFLVALTLFTCGTALCGIASSMKALIAARAIAGMGGGGVQAVATIATSDIIPLRERGLYHGYANILFATGAGLGGPLGGFINDSLGWRSAFLCQIPVLLISIFLVATKLNIVLPSRSESARERLKRIDYAGSITLVLAVSSLLLAVTLNSSVGVPWSNPSVWGLLLCAAMFITAFVLVEAYLASEPVMPLRLLRKRTPLAVALSNFLLKMVSFSMLYNVPIYFAAVKLTSSADAGLHLLPHSIAIGFGSIIAGFIIRKTGKVHKLSLLSAGFMVTSSLLVTLWNSRTMPLRFWIDIVPNGFGVASLLTSTLVALTAAVDRSDIAVATGISYLFRTTGQVLGVSLTGSLLQAVLVKNLHQRITGPGSSKHIQSIRHSITVIPSLDPEIQRAAVESYGLALEKVFMAQTAFAVLTLVACLPIQEFPLPGSHEERMTHEAGTRQGLSSGNSA